MALLGDIIDRGTNAARPAAGTEGRLYYQTDGTAGLYRDSGTAWEYCDPAATGGVATDAIWDAAGDLAVGSGANTAAKLTMGTALQQLRVNAGATGLEWAAPSGGSATFAGCRVRHSANQSIADAAAVVALAFNTEDYDSDAFHDTATNNSRLTVPSGKAGKYRIFGNVQWDSTGTPTAATYREVEIRLNGTAYLTGGRFQAAAYAATPLYTEYQLAVGDYVELVVAQSSAAALNVLTDARTNFGLSLIG